MWQAIYEAIMRADKMSALITITTVGIASAKNWYVAHQNLRATYSLMILLGSSYLCLNTNIALSGTGHEIVMLMNIPSLWTIVMGIKGLRSLRKAQDVSSRIRQTQTGH